MSTKQERLPVGSSLLTKWSLDAGKHGLGSSLLSTVSPLKSTMQTSLLSTSYTGSLLTDTSKSKGKEKLGNPKMTAAFKLGTKTEKNEKNSARLTGQLKPENVDSSLLLRTKVYQTPSFLSSVGKDSQSCLHSTLLSSSLLGSGGSERKGFQLSGSLKVTSHLSSLTSGSSYLSSMGSLGSSFQNSMGSLGSSFQNSMGSLGSSFQNSSFFGKPVHAAEKEERKAKKRKLKENGTQVYSYKVHEVTPPVYDMGRYVLSTDENIVQVPAFVDPEKDPSLMKLSRPVDDVNGMKMALINAVSGSLICQPRFKEANDSTRQQLESMSGRMVVYDPEFILKVALYTRKQLNIRTTANFLLALSANIHSCRPFLKKYYSAAIFLPSDWIEVAEIYQAFHDDNLNFGSLPAALRKAMASKFPDFDKYQLAKYNKESSQKKKKKKEKERANKDNGDVAPEQFRGRGRGRGRGILRGRGGRQQFTTDSVPAKKRRTELFDSSSSDSDSDEENAAVQRQKSVVYDEVETVEQLQQMSFTLKQLIRKLHITEPVEHVMCLIGKKYPTTFESFYQTRLPGTWEEERSGKRMKLPVPETWETQVSLKGNKAATWEDLIDHKKLPFMAMLRNLRNLIKAGISSKHHTWVLKKLTDERSVIYSKQFPFRFFSAYEVLQTLEKEYHRSQQSIIAEASGEETGVATAPWMDQGRGQRGGRRGSRGVGRGGANWWLDKKKKKDEQRGKTQETAFDNNLITRYRKALDTAVKIATTYNVQPIKGRTIILCDVGPDMMTPCTSARGLGKPRTMREVAVLLGLMCKYSCEECELLIFNHNAYTSVELTRGTILENMDIILSTDVSNTGSKIAQTFGLPDQVLWDILRDRIQVDNLVFLSGGTHVEVQKSFFQDFLKKYRQIVNPNMLYVNITFTGRNCGFAEEIVPEHDNDIYISGYSDQILRFIAERGDGGQLTHVENIDTAFQLKSIVPVLLEQIKRPKLDLSVPSLLPLLSQTPRWRTVRIFISSTFRDMHGERDLLTRYVFPELRALGKKHFINVYEVDLRWGVTEEKTRSHKTLELCLTEISKCQLFIGILGERYGWVPDKYVVPDTPEFDWVRDYQPGASITELEMHCAALSHSDEQKEKAFFYLRDQTFEKSVPKEFKSVFAVEDKDAKDKMEKLKNCIRQSGIEVYEGYPSQWGGVVDGKPILVDLEDFGARVMNNIWNAIQKFYPDEQTVLDEMTHINSLHSAFMENRKNLFIGRKTLIKDCVKKIIETKTGTLMLVGKPGSGKSSVLASLVSAYVESKQCDSAATILAHIVGAAPGSTNITATLLRLCHEMNRQFSLQEPVPKDFKNLTVKFGTMLKQAGNTCGSPFVLFVDGVDLMESSNQPQNMEWLPQPIPRNVVIVMTVLEGDKCHQALKRHDAGHMEVMGLDMWDKADVVRNNLSVHRKTLDESPFNNQLKLLVSKKEASNPLFLKLACEELRVFGVFEKITGKLKSMSHTVATLLQEILSRLEEDLGKDIVSTALSLLVCARDGLQSEELHELLSLQKILGKDKFRVLDILNIQMSPESAIPQALFAQLHRSLHSFLNPTDNWNTDLRLAHVGIEQAVRQRYLRGVSQEHEQILHRLMAGYFYQNADPDHNGSWKGNNIRSFSELPYHLICSGNFKELEKILCDLKFVHSKCHLGLALQLLEDFQPLALGNKFLEREHQKFLSNSTVQQYKSFVSRHLHILTHHPSLTWQQAINEPSDSIISKNVDHLISSSDIKQLSYMQWNSKPLHVDPCQWTISNLPLAITSVAVSADGMHVTCGGLDCIVRLYNMSTGKEIRTFRGHSDSISDVCFVGRDKICSASYDTTASIWHVQDGHRLFVLKGHNRRVNSCAADPSGNQVATASWDCYIKIWNANRGEQTCYLNAGSPVNCVDFHPEGQLIVTGSWDSTIKIWDVFHKTRKAILRGHSSSVRDVAYSPSGRHVASAAFDGAVKIWSALNGSQVGNISGHASPINKLIFSPTGKELVTVSDDHKVKVWSGNLGKLVYHLGKEEDGPVMSVALSPEGSTVAVGYHCGAVRQYDLLTGMMTFEVANHNKSVRCLKYGDNGAVIFSGSDDGNVIMLRAVDGEAVCTLKSHTKGVMCVEVAEEYVASGSEDFICYLYTSNSPWRTNRGTISPIAVLKGHTGPVTSCTFNPAITKVATASRDRSVMIWDLFDCLINPDPTPINVLHECHSDWITDCKWSNIGDYMVTASNDFNLKVWDMKTATEKFKLMGHMSSISSIALSYGCIVSSCSDGSVKVWSHKGTEITTLYGHTQRVNGCDMLVHVKKSEILEDVDTKTMDWADIVDAEEAKKTTSAMKPNIKIEDVTVATCGNDGTIMIWKPLQANEMASLSGHSDRVLSVASDKSGNLCTSSLDKSLKMWEMSVGSELVKSHDAEVTFVIGTADGKTLLSGSRDGVMKLWATVEDCAYPRCLQTIQAHKKSVNTACFLNKTGSQFVTGSDDKSITVWSLTRKDTVITSFRMKKSYTTMSPVTSLVWGSTKTGSGYVFFSAEWNGNIKVWNTDKSDALSEFPRKEGHKDWVLKLSFSVDGPKVLVSTGADGKVLFWDVSGPLGWTKKEIEMIKATTVSSDHVDKDIPVNKRAPTWVMDVAGNRGQCYAVDTKGQITCFTSRVASKDSLERTFLKIHSAAVTCLVFTTNIIVTASRDRTVKVWDKKLKQLGLFHAPAPVTCMTILAIRKTSNKMSLQLACGDLLGNVNFLTWAQ